MRSLVLALMTSWALINSAYAASEIPDCLSKGQVLPIRNDQVLAWKHEARNQYKNRGHVEGVIGEVYRDATGHRHFQIVLGDGARDTVEVIYNQAFGRIPQTALQPGAHVEVCGDYITSNKKTGRYYPSPDGAILHWVHASSNSRHDSGYVAIDGELYGFGSKNLEFIELEGPDSIAP